MVPHPDFMDTTLPRRAKVGAFTLTPLSGAEVDEDFAAIKASEPVLSGLFGDAWPAGVTRADNLVDLYWHDREFTAKRSFSWIIRDAADSYAGCAYLFPEIGARGRGKVVTWMCDGPRRVENLDAFNAAFGAWLAPFLPQGYDTEWVSNGAAFNA